MIIYVLLKNFYLNKNNIHNLIILIDMKQIKRCILFIYKIFAQHRYIHSGLNAVEIL